MIPMPTPVSSFARIFQSSCKYIHIQICQELSYVHIDIYIYTFSRREIDRHRDHGHWKIVKPHKMYGNNKLSHFIYISDTVPRKGNGSHRDHGCCFLLDTICVCRVSVALCCSVLQCVAVCCSVLQCVAVCCSVLKCVAVRCSVLQCVACTHVQSHFTHVSQNVAEYCRVLQSVAECCRVLQCVAVC